jgi:hypothetical protein
MFRTALKLARHRDLFAADDPALHERRAGFLREIDGVRRDVGVIEEITRQRNGIVDELLDDRIQTGALLNSAHEMSQGLSA